MLNESFFAALPMYNYSHHETTSKLNVSSRSINIPMTHVQLCGHRSEVVDEDHQRARPRCSQEGGRRESVPGREEIRRVRRTGRTRRDVLAPDDEGQNLSTTPSFLMQPYHIRLFFSPVVHFSGRSHARVRALQLQMCGNVHFFQRSLRALLPTDCLSLCLTGRGGDQAVSRGARGLHQAKVREDQQPHEGLLAEPLQSGELRTAGDIPNKR